MYTCVCFIIQFDIRCDCPLDVTVLEEEEGGGACGVAAARRRLEEKSPRAPPKPVSLEDAFQSMLKSILTSCFKAL